MRDPGMGGHTCQLVRGTIPVDVSFVVAVVRIRGFIPSQTSRRRSYRVAPVYKHSLILRTLKPRNVPALGVSISAQFRTPGPVEQSLRTPATDAKLRSPCSAQLSTFSRLMFEINLSMPALTCRRFPPNEHPGVRYV